MQYKIVKMSDPQRLVDAVNSEMAAGWRPLGGVSIASWINSNFGPAPMPDSHYVQAMVRGE